MKLYHGTNMNFDRIDLKKSKPGKDFGELLRRGRMLHFSGLEKGVALRQLLGEYQKLQDSNSYHGVK